MQEEKCSYIVTVTAGKVLHIDLTQKLASAALSDTALAAGKARKEPPPRSRSLCCLASMLRDPGCIFSFLPLFLFPFSFLLFLLDFLEHKIFRVRYVFAWCLTQWGTILA